MPDLGRGVDSSASYLQHALILSACFIGGMDFALLASSFKALEEDLGLTPLILGTMGFAQASSASLAAPVWGWMCDSGYASRRQLMAYGAMGFGAMMGVAGCSSGTSALIVSRFFMGAFLACLTPLCQSWVADNIAAAKRGSVFGRLGACWQAGAIVCASVTVSIASTDVPVGPLSIDGWRIVCFVICLLSFILSAALAAWLDDDEPRHRPQDTNFREGFHEMLINLAQHWKIPSFRVVIFQGLAGSIPWSAMSFEAMLFVYMGFTPEEVSMMILATAPAQIIGPLLGGYLGDWAAWLSPHKGRTFLALFSVTSGIPLALWVIKGLPDIVGLQLGPYIFVKSLFYLTATYCNAGVKRPILLDIVRPCCRASIVAWDQAMEGTVAAALGLPVLGFVVQEYFGYIPTSLSVDEMSPTVRQHNLQALQTALTVMYIVPWAICFGCFTLLLSTLKKDVERAKEKHDLRDDVEKVPLLLQKS